MGLAVIRNDVMQTSFARVPGPGVDRSGAVIDPVAHHVGSREAT